MAVVRLMLNTIAAIERHERNGVCPLKVGTFNRRETNCEHIDKADKIQFEYLIDCDSPDNFGM